MPVPAKKELDRSKLSETARKFMDVGTGGKSILIAQPEYFFYLTFRDTPSNWSIRSEGLRKPLLLPTLQRDWVDYGANGVVTVGEGALPSVSVQKRHYRLAQDGVVVLSPALGYHDETPCQTPKTKVRGTIHHTTWESFTQKGRRVRKTFDRAKANEFLIRCMKEKILPLPDEDIVLFKAEDQEERAELKRTQYKGTEAQITALVKGELDQIKLLKEAFQNTLKFFGDEDVD